MTTVKKYDITGKEVGSVKIDAWLAEAEVNSQLVKDYIVAIRNNARQWNAHTKTRSEVVHTTKKPHPQKGGGRARQGSLVSPQYRGGGRVFGPRHKEDQHVKINKKEKKAAIRALIGEKIREGKFIVIDDAQMKEPKTKSISSFLKALEMKRNTLFVGEGTWGEIEVHDFKHRFSEPSESHENFIKSLRNLPKASFSLASNVSGFDVLKAEHIVVTAGALEELTEWLS